MVLRASSQLRSVSHQLLNWLPQVSRAVRSWPSLSIWGSSRRSLRWPNWFFYWQLNKLFERAPFFDNTNERYIVFHFWNSQMRGSIHGRVVIRRNLPPIVEIGGRESNEMWMGLLRLKTFYQAGPENLRNLTIWALNDLHFTEQNDWIFLVVFLFNKSTTHSSWDE